MRNVVFVLVLAIAAYFAPVWVSPFLEFLDFNRDSIDVISDFSQILLAIVTLFTLYFGVIKQNPAAENSVSKMLDFFSQVIKAISGLIKGFYKIIIALFGMGWRPVTKFLLLSFVWIATLFYLVIKPDSFDFIYILESFLVGVFALVVLILVNNKAEKGTWF